VDLITLKQMGDSDLKELGIRIPMVCAFVCIFLVNLRLQSKCGRVLYVTCVLVLIWKFFHILNLILFMISGSRKKILLAVRSSAKQRPH
jgi:hypothetical protein